MRVTNEQLAAAIQSTDDEVFDLAVKHLMYKPVSEPLLLAAIRGIEHGKTRQVALFRGQFTRFRNVVGLEHTPATALELLKWAGRQNSEVREHVAFHVLKLLRPDLVIAHAGTIRPLVAETAKAEHGLRLLDLAQYIWTFSPAACVARITALAEDEDWDSLDEEGSWLSWVAAQDTQAVRPWLARYLPLLRLGGGGAVPDLEDLAAGMVYQLLEVAGYSAWSDCWQLLVPLLAEIDDVDGELREIEAKSAEALARLQATRAVSALGKPESWQGYHTWHVMEFLKHLHTEESLRLILRTLEVGDVRGAAAAENNTVACAAALRHLDVRAVRAADESLARRPLSYTIENVAYPQCAAMDILELRGSEWDAVRARADAAKQKHGDLLLRRDSIDRIEKLAAELSEPDGRSQATGRQGLAAPPGWEPPDAQRMRPKLQPNDACFCGSGRKFKRCCMGRK